MSKLQEESSSWAVFHTKKTTGYYPGWEAEKNYLLDVEEVIAIYIFSNETGTVFIFALYN